ncbi:MAG: sulfite exporter TauE/SafE family protein, partial [Candidatus Levyibacteriota bacterium]
MDITSLTTIFLTGLFTGGLSCMAVQGGLVTATIAQREQEKLEHKLKNTNSALPILSFLIAKLIAYTLFGFALGWL